MLQSLPPATFSFPRHGITNHNLLRPFPLSCSLLRRHQCSRLRPFAGAQSRGRSGGIRFELGFPYRSFGCAVIDGHFEALNS
ncbi:unnamed protein product [Sphenostylis stenocarpa]|uniref:Uncharacterized protein n=1 Tax=Sphenostylis stenocarpa TaxID=92480 RepID=A0AA86SH27_9FABA|nr:unnamed protein product [Sphenostylis stenocarpa]